MEKAVILERLKNLEMPLRSAGVRALYLFGSANRGDFNGESDIDLLFEADPVRRFSLIDQAQLQVELSAALGRPVDFIERRSLRPGVRAGAEADLLRIF
jgi:predicted nucleotidyltransferase